MEVDYGHDIYPHIISNDCGPAEITTVATEIKGHSHTHTHITAVYKTIKHVEMINKINFNENLSKLVLAQTFLVVVVCSFSLISMMFCVCVCISVTERERSVQTNKPMI